MKRYFLSAWLLLVFAAQGFAQAPAPPAADSPPGAEFKDAPQVRRQLAAPLGNQFDPFRQPQNQFDDELKAAEVTPEMWLYMQEMRRYNDPLQAVRANAANRAAHRRARLAAQQWFGFSNSRPQASTVPFMDVYSPVWSANSWNPYTWTGTGNAWTAVRVDPIVITR